MTSGSAKPMHSWASNIYSGYKFSGQGCGTENSFSQREQIPCCEAITLTLHPDPPQPWHCAQHRAKVPRSSPSSKSSTWTTGRMTAQDVMSVNNPVQRKEKWLTSQFNFARICYKRGRMVCFNVHFNQWSDLLFEWKHLTTYTVFIHTLNFVAKQCHLYIVHTTVSPGTLEHNIKDHVRNIMVHRPNKKSNQLWNMWMGFVYVYVKEGCYWWLKLMRTSHTQRQHDLS